MKLERKIMVSGCPSSLDSMFRMKHCKKKVNTTESWLFKEIKNHQNKLKKHKLLTWKKNIVTNHIDTKRVSNECYGFQYSNKPH